MKVTHRRFSVAPILVGLVAVLLALFSGLVVGVGGLFPGAVLSALLVAALTLLLPVNWLVVGTWVTATLIAGTVQYLLGGWKYAQWAPFGLAFACLLRLPFELLKRRHRPVAEDAPQARQDFSWTLGFAALLFVVALFSTALNGVSVVQFIVAFKNQAVMWAFALLIAYGCVPQKTNILMWKSLLAILTLQLPMVIYQHFFVAARRATQIGGAPADAVAGTFGGNPNAGGANVVLVLFAVAAASLAFSFYRNKQLRLRWMVVIGLLMLAVIGLGEVKIAMILLPVACIVLYLEQFVRRPQAIIGWSVFTVLFVGSLLLLYQELYWSKQLGNYKDLSSSLQSSIEYVVNPNNIDNYSGEVGRFASMNLWYQDTTNYIVQRLIGNGANASRSDSAVAIGEVARRYAPLNISATAVSQLLWDYGVVGLLLYIGIFVAGFLEATRAIKRALPGTLDESFLRVSRVLFVMCLFLIPYNNHLLEQASLQVLLGLGIGHLVWFQRNGRWAVQQGQPLPGSRSVTSRSLGSRA